MWRDDVSRPAQHDAPVGRIERQVHAGKVRSAERLHVPAHHTLELPRQRLPQHPANDLVSDVAPDTARVDGPLDERHQHTLARQVAIGKEDRGRQPTHHRLVDIAWQPVLHEHVRKWVLDERRPVDGTRHMRGDASRVEVRGQTRDLVLQVPVEPSGGLELFGLHPKCLDLSLEVARGIVELVHARKRSQHGARAQQAAYTLKSA